MMGSILGLASSVAGGIMSGVQSIQAKKAEKNANQLMDAQQTKLDNLFNADYYGNYMNRTDVQSMLTQARQFNEDQNKINRNMAVISGATPETTIAQQKVGANTMGNAISNIAAGASGFKESVKNNYLAQTSALQDRRIGSYQNAANMFSQSSNNNLSSAITNLPSFSNIKDFDIFKRK